MTRRRVACLGIGVALLVGAGATFAGERTPLAVLGDETIYVEDVEGAVAFRVYRHRVDIHSLLRGEAERRVDEILLAREAERRGTTVEGLLEAVRSEAPPVAEEEVERYLAEHPPDARVTPEQARARVRSYLEETRRIERRLALVERLRREAGYRFVLPPPEPPRTEVDVAGAPARGPADAAVTVVHFASFSSRQSARSAEKLSRLVEAWPGEIRWIHRNLIQERDETGLLAAQLGAAAQRAGLFWPLHDAWFARGGRLDAETVRALAREAGLDADTVERAPRDPELLRRVKRDFDAANAAGAPREPTLFVNGRYVAGISPYEELRAVLAEEIGRARDARAAASRENP